MTSKQGGGEVDRTKTTVSQKVVRPITKKTTYLGPLSLYPTIEGPDVLHKATTRQHTNRQEAS